MGVRTMLFRLEPQGSRNVLGYIVLSDFILTGDKFFCFAQVTPADFLIDNTDRSWAKEISKYKR